MANEFYDTLNGGSGHRSSRSRSRSNVRIQERVEEASDEDDESSDASMSGNSRQASNEAMVVQLWEMQDHRVLVLYVRDPFVKALMSTGTRGAAAPAGANLYHAVDSATRRWKSFLMAPLPLKLSTGSPI